jgi:hypothetical protein
MRASSAAISGRSLGLCLAIALLFPPLTAAEPNVDCAAHAVALAGPLEPQWRDELARVCRRLAQRHDIDPSVTLEIDPSPARGLTLRATLADGRIAARHVDSIDALSHTLEALLVLPVPISTKPAAADAAPRAVAPPVKRETPHASQESLLHVGLGGSLIGTLFFPPTYAAAGFAARASLRLGSLLIDVTPRWEVEQATVRSGLPDFEMHHFGLGFTLGARLAHFPEGVIEAGLGMLILEETQSERESGKEIDSSKLSAQLLGQGRFLWGGPGLRGSLGLELSLAPSRLARAVHLRDILPALPPFGIGISFGVHWESE